jgi:cytochrome c biogenesis protein CcmG/thiol:disulfide interchange protein DsbE
MSRLFPVLLLLVGLTTCDRAPEGPFEGRVAPALRGAGLSGETVDLRSLRGKPTVVVFWASWCGPCRAEAPEVVRVARSYGARIHVVGVNTGEDAGVARRVAGQWGMTWPVVLDHDGRIASTYAVQGIPLVLIVDENGIVRHRNNGLPSDIHRLLDGLLG